jgi:hypothetical protein
VARAFRYCCKATRYFCSSYIINEGRMDKVFSFCFSPSLSRITSNFSMRDAFWCLYFLLVFSSTTARKGHSKFPTSTSQFKIQPRSAECLNGC